jgi:hypothetical protein
LTCGIEVTSLARRLSDHMQHDLARIVEMPRLVKQVALGQ